MLQGFNIYALIGRNYAQCSGTRQDKVMPTINILCLMINCFLVKRLQLVNDYVTEVLQGCKMIYKIFPENQFIMRYNILIVGIT